MKLFIEEIIYIVMQVQYLSIAGVISIPIYIPKD